MLYILADIVWILAHLSNPGQLSVFHSVSFAAKLYWQSVSVVANRQLLVNVRYVRYIQFETSENIISDHMHRPMAAFTLGLTVNAWCVCAAG